MCKVYTFLTLQPNLQVVFGENKVEDRTKNSLKAKADVRPVVDDLYAYVVALILLTTEEIATIMSDLIHCHGDILKGVVVERNYFTFIYYGGNF